MLVTYRKKRHANTQRTCEVVKNLIQFQIIQQTHTLEDNNESEEIKMLNLKKIGAILLAVMMMAMAAAAWADEDMTDTNGVIGAFTAADIPTVQDGAVLIYKEITAYNKDNSTVNAPALSYTYTITPLDGGKSITDAGGTTLHASGNPVAVLTKDSPTGATISGSVDGGTTYTSGALTLTNAVQLTTADDGYANKFPIKIDFSGVDWPGAGVYRYQISESTAAGAKVAAGVTDGGIAETLYMDVYVKDGSTSGYEIYGYTCFKTNDDIDGRSSTSNLTTIQKTEGFVTGDTDGDGTTETSEEADKYYTFNLEISKTLTGDQAQNSNQFPFSVDFTNASVTANILLKQETTAGGGITANLPAAAAVSSLDVSTDNLKLANGAKVKYIGIPVGVTAGTTVAVYELNNVTGTVYKSSYVIDGGTASTAKSINWTATTNQSDTATLTITMNADDDTSHTIAFTNALEQISPTGYVARYAPYALMLIGGIVLLVIAKKHKKHSEED